MSLTEEQHFQRAAELEATGDHRAALIEWKNVLQKNPEHAEARLRLGRLALELEDLPTARSELRRAAALGVDPIRVAPELARLWLMEGQYSRVLEELRPEDFADDEALVQGRILLLRGDALTRLGRLEEGRTSFESALEQSPDLPLAHVGIARIDAAQRRPEPARSRLHNVLTQEPSLHEGWSLLGDLERFEGRLEEAESAYGKAIAHGATPYLNHLMRALTRMALQDLPGVEEDLQAMLRLGPREPGTAYVQGLLHLQQGRFAEAQTAFEEALGRAPDFQPAVFYLGASHFSQQRWLQAELHLKRFLRAHPESDDAARLLALVRAQEGDVDGAQALLKPVLGRNPDDVLALSLSGNLHLARGEHAEGIGQLRRVTSLQPDDPATRASLAAGLLRAGERDAALRELEAAIEQTPGQYGLEVNYVLNLIRAGEFAAALEGADRLTAALPASPLPHNLRAAAYIGMGDAQRAREALLDALQVEPGDPAVSINLAEMAVQDGNRDEARRIYRESLAKHSGHVGVSMRLAQLEAKGGNIDAMRSTLEESIKLHPEALAPRLMLANHHLHQDEPRRALALLEPVRESAAEDVQMLDLLARAQIAAGRNLQAVTTLRALAEHMPESAETRFRLGAAFERAASLPEARRQYRRALELDPKFPQALQNLAALELREGRHDEALALARRMQKLEAVAATGFTIEGRVHRANGDHGAAAEAFEAAYVSGPSADNAIVLALAQQQQGHSEEATELLAARLAEYPDEDAVRFHLAQALMVIGDQPGAIREYEDLAVSQPDNAAVLNNLAFLYQAAGDPRALEYAERAQALLPDSPVVADTLGWILVNQGEINRGLQLLETARRSLPERPEVRFHYAAGLAKAGRKSEAEQELAALLNDVESFPQRADAEALLQTLR